MVNDFLDNTFRLYNNKIHANLPDNALNNKIKAILFDLSLWNKVSKNGDVLEWNLDNEISVKMDDRAGYNALVSESNYVEKFIQNLDEETVVVDVGGHHGFYSVLGSYFTDETVTVFEIDKNNLNHLQRNVELNESNVEIISKAVSDSVGRENFNMEGTGLSSIGESGDIVKTTTLDSELQVEPDIIKIDVEGAELKVLKGAENTIDNFRPVIFIEIHKRDRLKSFDHEPEDVKNILQEHGYKLDCLQEGNYDDLYIAKSTSG